MGKLSPSSGKGDESKQNERPGPQTKDVERQCIDLGSQQFNNNAAASPRQSREKGYDGTKHARFHLSKSSESVKEFHYKGAVSDTPKALQGPSADTEYSFYFFRSLFRRGER